MPTSPATHCLTVGDRAHRIAAIVLRSALPGDRAQTAIALSRAGRRVFNEHPVDYRSREALLDAVTAAGVYIHRFRPQMAWELVGDELVEDGCRFDLVYRHANGRVLIDELKLGVGRSDEAAVRDQLHRYLEAGRRLWSTGFVGVRLCAVHEPLRSRLHLPEEQQQSILLTDPGVPDGLAVR